LKLEEQEEKARLEAQHKLDLIRQKEEEANLYIDDEDVAAPEFTEDTLPTPGLSLNYLYYLWTQIQTLSTFATTI